MELLIDAIKNTTKNRGSDHYLSYVDDIFKQLYNSQVMESLWNQYKNKYLYIEDIDWHNLLHSMQLISVNIKKKR